jgi:hypothetical protein
MKAPVTAVTPQTLRQSGLTRTTRIGLSYPAALLRKVRHETTLEQFLINRFGRELYLTFW